MRAYRAYKPPNAPRSPSRAASTSEESAVGSGAGAVVTARQSLIVRRESTVVPACNRPTPNIIPVGMTLWSEGMLTTLLFCQLRGAADARTDSLVQVGG